MNEQQEDNNKDNSFRIMVQKSISSSSSSFGHAHTLPTCPTMIFHWKWFPTFRLEFNSMYRRKNSHWIVVLFSGYSYHIMWKESLLVTMLPMIMTMMMVVWNLTTHIKFKTLYCPCSDEIRKYCSGVNELDIVIER